MMFSLRGKVAVVTGGGQGIGRACCLALAKQGADVAILDRKIETANLVKAEIDNMGHRAMAIQADVSKLLEVSATVETIIGTFGKIDIWVNNAGWGKTQPFLENSPETWDRIIAVNLNGTINCCHAVLPFMVKQGSGKLINIGSDSGRIGTRGDAVYSAVKGGVIALTKALALENAHLNINVNCLCPGPTSTPLLNGLKITNPVFLEDLISTIPWGRLGKPEEIAAGVVFLASEEASFVTGQTLSVNGGFTMV